MASSNSEPWLLSSLGDEFKLVRFGAPLAGAEVEQITLPPAGVAAERYDAEEGTAYLVRPDQVVAARWKSPSSENVQSALMKATAQ